MIKPIL